MLDLKSKLLEAGLVTKEQVNVVEKKQLAKKAAKKYKKTSAYSMKPKSKNQVADFDESRRKMHLDTLKGMTKNQQYELIRKWVDKNRLDKGNNGLSDTCEKYFFEKLDKSITWLTLEKEVCEKIKIGNAGIMTFMSNAGLSNCVIARDIAEDAAQVFPEWIRVLKDLSAKS